MFEPSRLTLARQRRGLTKVALAQAVGLTPRRISAFENEGEQPPASTVEALAKVLDFPSAFFSRSAGDLVEAERASLRSFSRLSARTRDAGLASVTLGAEFARWLEARFELPPVNLSDLRGVGPREAAAALRSLWGLGEIPAPNMVHLLEANGVMVFSLSDEFVALDALSVWIEERPFVYLTLNKSPERGRWDAAHELGHLVMHIGLCPQGRAVEREADEFASEFLLPERGVRGRVPRFPSLEEVRSEKLFWRVSALAYIRRLYQLGAVTEWQYKSLAIEASKAGYRSSEGEIERETSQLIPKVLTLLAEDGISVSSVSAELAITPAELRGLLFSPVGLQGEGLSTETSRPELRVLNGYRYD